ncbi:MAG: aminomethyl-transferring glycine dehydrogenase [Verrucomicrobiae bacterium]|nr:aminomethyl-transferring glycine dehydrogenase [Verrucomicrobiae bacterium]
MANATLTGPAGSDTDSFLWRHLGPRADEIGEMARACGYDSLEALVGAAVPAGIRMEGGLDLPGPMGEVEALERLKTMAARNEVYRSLMGMGYYGTVMPAVIRRNILENPGWYTQYTPYQSEISQGRLEGLLNFQTLVTELTGMDIANASLLDEATACAEAMMMCHRVKAGEGRPGEAPRDRFFVADTCHPQSVALVRGRAEALGLAVEVGDWRGFEGGPRYFGALIQYPDTFGEVHDPGEWAARIRSGGVLVVVATDLLALTVLRPPGEWGADVAVGSAQRFGVPMGYGGPHAAFFATREVFRRSMPGRLVGVSRDSRGRPALRLSLGTREQHIRREKATSNICTAQALLANLAMAYACYHGPEGLRAMARRVHERTARLASGLERLGCRLQTASFFDTLTVEVADAGAVHRAAQAHRINLRPLDATRVGVSLDEMATEAEVEMLWRIFGGEREEEIRFGEVAPVRAAWVERTTPYLRHPVFHRYRSETEMQRYLRRLESRDLSLCHSMIPLGSCTMKLNAAAEMLPLSWPEWNGLHPFAPEEQAAGYRELFRDLEDWLGRITGLPGVSLQPNAGSQGEYAGLLVIRAWHRSRGEGHRDVCLIPTSAHGTNPASAVMAGMRVVPVGCDGQGNIDLDDLQARVSEHRAQLACLMVTYPSTHGVFEASIREVSRWVHEAGGQVYLDGANMNAQVGLTSSGLMGADVCHLNLHKTFCIPHGGGGPGVGPICVAEHLTAFLPGHPLGAEGETGTIPAVSAAPWGSASLLPIPWMYIRMMGGEGLTLATQVAILNANYVAKRLEGYFPTLYRGEGGLVAHECILDLRPFKSVTAEDVAKRLIDYGFHAPTLSWPVAGTLMVEPTESESRAELDRFCEAMKAIHREIMAIERGEADPKNNLLKNAPHTADQVAADVWDRPYSREAAAFPVAGLRETKVWPSVSRVDNVYGDRNLVCSCVGMEAYAG